MDPKIQAGASDKARSIVAPAPRCFGEVAAASVWRQGIVSSLQRGHDAPCAGKVCEWLASASSARGSSSAQQHTVVSCVTSSKAVRGWKGHFGTRGDYGRRSRAVKMVCDAVAAGLSRGRILGSTAPCCGGDPRGVAAPARNSRFSWVLSGHLAAGADSGQEFCNIRG